MREIFTQNLESYCFMKKSKLNYSNLSEEITKMLVNFRFSNFMSFEKLNEFSLVKGKSKQHPFHLYSNKDLDISTLKFSAIYGANGAGKSNFVKVFKFVQELIVLNKFESSHRDLYCRTHTINKDQSSDFEFELLLNDKVYSYGFSVNLHKKIFLREWMYEISNNSEVEYFTYDYSLNELNVKLPLNNSDLSTRFKIYKDDYLNLKNTKKSLFLNFINSSKSEFKSEDNTEIHLEALNGIFNWFKNNLEVILPNKAPKKAFIYLGNSEVSDITNFLIDFGTGIKKVSKELANLEEIYKIDDKNFIDYILEEATEKIVNSKKKIYKGIARSNKNLYAVYAKKDSNYEIEIEWFIFKFSLNNDTQYSLGELSDGTIRLLELYSVLNNKSNKTFIVDEIDRSLHPNLTLNFLKYYLSKNINTQLIATTHEDRILDLELLRRDEIWFVERDENDCSQLYSLEKFKIRFDQDVMKAYLDGRYGSVPKFKFF